MAWSCPAINHGVAIFPNGKIGPCCQVQPEYLKPIELLHDPDRFADLKTDIYQDVCRKCIQSEARGESSYRQGFKEIQTFNPGIQFLDIRNTNFCNLKCRYCGPHFSSQWAQELDNTYQLQKTEIPDLDKLLNGPSLHWMYFTGGEPLINHEHWDILEKLISNGRASKIKLRYNSNLTTLKFKDKDIVNIWKQFKQVDVNVSIDSTGTSLNYIRSGANWDKIQNNIQHLIENNVDITFNPVISILNIWFVKSLFEYASKHNIPVQPNVLQGPDYLAINVVPDELKEQILQCIDELESFISASTFNYIKDLAINNQNQCLFQHTLSHILLIDKLRDEKLFELLPFKNIATTTFLRNYEYQ